MNKAEKDTYHCMGIADKRAALTNTQLSELVDQYKQMKQNAFICSSNNSKALRKTGTCSYGV